MVHFNNVVLTMAFILTLIVSAVISTQSIVKKLNRMNYVAYAITEIVENLSEKDLMKFDVVVYGHDEQLHFLAEKIIKNIANVSNLVNIEQKSHNEEFLSICGQAPKIILASQELEVDVNELLKSEEYQFYLYHDSVIIFYYLNESNLTVYEKTFDKLTFNIKPRALFISHTTDQNSNNLKLYGYVKYLTCTDTFNLTLRNTFNASPMKWTHQTFQHEYKNCNGCPLRVYAPRAIECALVFRQSGRKIIGIGFVYGDLLNLYAEKHNAIVQVESLSKPDPLKFDIALIHTTFFEEVPRGKFLFTPTVAIDEHKLAIIVTRGDEFTPFEKLILPFDSATWYLNIFTILVGFIVILILYQMPTYMQKFVFGTYNRNPSLGLSQIFFGIGLIQTPSRNFARFIFMMFTIFCLIIRTAYQSKMYDFLQYDERQPTLKTIQEVLQQKNIPIARYRVYLSDELKKDLNLPVEPTLEEINRFFAADFKGTKFAFIMDRAFYKCFKNAQPGDYRNIEKKMRMTDDDLVSGLNSWYIYRFSVVHNSLNKFLLECHQHGIISYLKKKPNFYNRYAPEEETKNPLTLHMLSAGFYVWLASIGIACVVFVLEHIHKRVTQQ